MDVSSNVVIMVPGLTKLPTLTCLNPVRPLNDARITVSSSRAWAAATRASSAFNDAVDQLEVRHRQRLTRLQIAAALVLALAAREQRLRLGERGSRLHVVHLDENRRRARLPRPPGSEWR